MPALVEIVDYDQRWPEQFRHAAGRLSILLGRFAASIDHVGSTAVPGLAAKPLIDIDITLASPADMNSASSILVTEGYEPRGSRHGDGVFAFLLHGTPGRRVYLCPPDSRTHADRMIFRDRLRRDPAAALAYVSLKRMLASLFPRDGDRYTQAKGNFIRSLVQDGIVLALDRDILRLREAAGYDTPS